ncbi:protein-disulfide reductase DsbD domain-containing protein [Jannaschia sp. M317]|uniref:protein-disulfide reductase DsbD domain-containing protein n=1 Tax=Jannaschia sp. M317 TaxID=2867011 RepID=UPI0021A76BE6|nr:protein-disulfide reductase DsbD domain-containing protein [Jannaschia sp. M317]UWQ17967.1 hypothetical protein K3551_01270 [Jannaschia sp. M317]
MILQFCLRLAAIAALAGALVLATGQLAMAQAGPEDMSDVISVEVLPGWRAADGTHVAALRVSLRPGWRTYWRTAGSGGIAPQFDWSRSGNVAQVAAAWPTPQIFRQGDYISIGYTEGFVLPLIVTPTDQGRAMDLQGDLNLGVCAEICLPAQLAVGAALPDVGQPDASIHAAMLDRPRRLSTDAHCTVVASKDGAILSGVLDLPFLGGTEAVVFELDDQDLWVTDATVERDGDQLRATSELMATTGGAVDLDTGNVRMTVIGASGAVELRGCL